MITLVISGGDSFTFGSELRDTHNELTPSKTCWANLIANKLNAKHCNTGRGARGNSFITRHVIYKVNQALRLGYKPEEIFVQVMWSFWSRSEIAVNFHTQTPFDSPWYYLYPHMAEDESKSEWVMNAIKEHSIKKFRFANGDTKADRFAKSLHSEYKTRKELGLVDFAKHHYTITDNLNDIYKSLKSVLLLQNFLENRNIKYMYTYVDFTIYEAFLNMEPKNKFVNNLRDAIKFYGWYTFPGYHKYEWDKETITTPYGFTDWTKRHGYEIGVSHPLEKAHANAADLIYERVKEIIK